MGLPGTRVAGRKGFGELDAELSAIPKGSWSGAVAAPEFICNEREHARTARINEQNASNIFQGVTNDCGMGFILS
jgi:hypothetical protein